jgi:hypothetical protein
MTTDAKEIALQQAKYNAMRQVPFFRPLSLMEMGDLVCCVEQTIVNIERELEEIQAHTKKCKNPKCLSNAKLRTNFLTRKHQQLRERAAELGPQWAKQCEHLEYLIARQNNWLEE